MSLFIKNLQNQLANINLKKLETLKNIIDNHTADIFLLGNGGSNAISAHMAEDYSKALQKRAHAFTDGARLTCYANDYGYDFAFLEFLKQFVSTNSLVILISSSGNSKNIINCAEYCAVNSIPFIILTGFDKNNYLRQYYSSKALLEFWIDSNNYGVVECLHEVILHSVI